MEGGDALRAKLVANAERFRSSMTKLGFTLAGADHPIIPVMLGDAALEAGALDLGQRFFLRGMDASHLDDVIAEVGLDDTGDIAFLEAEGTVLERLDHHAPAEEAEIAALGGRTRVVGILLGQLGEGCRCLAYFGQQLFSPGLCLVFTKLFRSDQDVTGPAFFRLLEAILAAVVGSLDLGVADRQLGGDGFHRQDDIFRLGHFRRLELLAVFVEIGRAHV